MGPHLSSLKLLPLLLANSLWCSCAAFHALFRLIFQAPTAPRYLINLVRPPSSDSHPPHYSTHQPQQQPIHTTTTTTTYHQLHHLPWLVPSRLPVSTTLSGHLHRSHRRRRRSRFGVRSSLCVATVAPRHDCAVQPCIAPSTTLLHIATHH
jgi:hypothetical protein